MIDIKVHDDGSAVLTSGHIRIELDPSDACTLAVLHLLPKTGDADTDLLRRDAAINWFDEVFASGAHDASLLPSFPDMDDPIIAHATGTGDGAVTIQFGVVKGFEDDHYASEIWEATERVEVDLTERVRLFEALAGLTISDMEVWQRAITAPVVSPA